MKLTVFLFFVAITQMMALESYSQSTRLSLNFKDATVKEVLEKIEENSEFVFLYNTKLVNVDRSITMDFKNQKISDVLDKIFKETNVVYTVIDKQIVLTNTTDQVSFLGLNNQQQQKSVSGIVTDSSGGPLPGVSVVVKGTTIGITTDSDGKYNLANLPTNTTLVFSFVGMKSQEISVGQKSAINITLEEESIGLDEVVAIGYGTQKKVNLTGAIGLATSERLENRPIVSAGQGLQGVIPNLNVSIRNGDPTTSADFNIRGYESINGGSPLILVDGVPMDLEMINPADIASVSVLKDAAASAIYGARAAFGVILVETKKGKTDKFNVTLNMEQSAAKPIWLADDMVTDPYLYVTTYNKAYIRTNGQPAYDEDYVASVKRWSENPSKENAWGVVNGDVRYYGNNNYRDNLIANSSPQQKYDISVSGRTGLASYYVSMGYLNKDGYLKNVSKNDHFKRYNILMKAEFELADWITIDEKIVFNSQISNKPHFYNWDVNINSTVRVPPIQPIAFPDLEYYNEPGDREQYAPYIGKYFGGTNWFPYLEDGGRTTFTENDTWFTQGITLIPFKGMRIRSDFSYNTFHRVDQDVASKIEVVSTNLLTDPLVDNGFSVDDYITNESRYNQYYVFNAYSEYTFDQNANHYFKAMVGFNQEWGLNTWFSASAKQLITPSITDIS